MFQKFRNTPLINVAEVFKADTEKTWINFVNCSELT